MTIIKIVNAISVDFIFDDYDDYDDYELRLPLYYLHIISLRKHLTQHLLNIVGNHTCERLVVAGAAVGPVVARRRVTESHLFAPSFLCGICVINAIGLCLIMNCCEIGVLCSGALRASRAGRPHLWNDN